MRVIAFANQKGGVGKTTSCVNLSICLSQSGRRVLLVDMDPQANATVYLGMNSGERTYTSRFLLDSPHFDLERAIVRTESGIDVIPSDRKLLESNKTLLPEYGRETRLRDKLENYAEGFSPREYDYVLVDCAPSLDLVTINALMAATDLVVPVQPRFFALKGLEELASMVGELYRTLNPRVKVMGIIITMFDKTAALDKSILELLKGKVEREFGSYIFPSVIYKSVLVSESEKRLPVVLHDPEAPASKAYQEIAAEIMRR